MRRLTKWLLLIILVLAAIALTMVTVLKERIWGGSKPPTSQHQPSQNKLPDVPAE
jgi:hypothetical protein